MQEAGCARSHILGLNRVRTLLGLPGENSQRGKSPVRRGRAAGTHKAQPEARIPLELQWWQDVHAGERWKEQLPSFFSTSSSPRRQMLASLAQSAR